ncbi:MAG: hypothetical protein Q9187_002324 [Circinaria calcarea]
MADSVVLPQLSNGLTINPLQVNERVEYEKLLKIRDEIVAGTHPRLKLPAKTPSIVTPPSTKPPPPTSAPQPLNGFATKAPNPTPKAGTLSKTASDPSPPVNKFTQKNATSRQVSSSGRGSSGLDPIFLTKSEDLVRAEMRLERQRIERSLEEQVHQRKLSAKQRLSDQEAIPDFDVSEVLFQAQELVKPLAANEEIGANRTASSSDSFDENTFYSSQINDSAPEEADEHPKRRATRPCKFFFEGACKKGDACTFSHDPAFKQQLQRNGSLAMDVDNLDVSRHTSPKLRERPCDGATNGIFIRPSPTYTNRIEDPGGRSLDPIQVSQSTTRKNILQTHGMIPRDIDDEMDYSPPGVRTLRNGQNLYNDTQTGPVSHRNGPHSSSRHPPHNGVQRNEDQTSASPPIVNNVRVVRNHITSPIAPQPARVSPLAVAKAPRLTQLQHVDQRNGTPRMGGKLVNAQNDPNTTIPPTSSRKRRRDPDPREATRNVTARRYLDSPGPYIKQEPVSTPPLTDVPSVGPSQRRPVGREPLIIESTSPQYGERVVYQPRRVVQNPRTEIPELQDRSTPEVRRVVSRAGHQYQLQDEPDLRRVVTARLPMRNQSPLPDFAVPRLGPQYQLPEEPELRRVASARHPVRYQSPVQEVAQYSMPQPESTRAISHSYIIQPEPDLARQYRASVQPRPISHLRHDRSLSPQPLHNPYTTSRETVPMAPPPRRIVVDQYGNKYYETPLPIERRASVAPSTRYLDDATSPYEQPASRKPITRAQVVEGYDGQNYVQRFASPAPTSPRYVEYYPAVEPARTESRQRIYQPAEDVVRVIDYPDDRLPARYEEVVRPSELYSRMQSVQPVGREYEVVRERAPRIQSVRPDYQRIVTLGNQQELQQQFPRQVSIRAEDRYARAPNYAALERPRYQYISKVNNSQFVEGELPEEAVMEAARSVERRPTQRL